MNAHTHTQPAPRPKFTLPVTPQLLDLQLDSEIKLPSATQESLKADSLLPNLKRTFHWVLRPGQTQCLMSRPTKSWNVSPLELFWRW